MFRLLVAAFACILTVRLLINVDLRWFDQKIDELKFIRQPVRSSNSSAGSKWIVVTSVQYPTENVKRLASYPGWTLVVVADTKTPTDWHLEGVHFLSMQIQEEMSKKYDIIAGIPFKSYTRKNIGYLYAIENGAEWIYDTDDDNVPTDRGLDEFDYGDVVSGLRFQLPDEESNSSRSQRLFNPYRHFGRPSIWPRGFPLQDIQDHVHREGSYRLCTENKRPAVQQGIVRKDPDVDAVYRLLHADKQSGLNEDFHPFAPSVILAPGTYSPWNSQNTLFHRDAFFGLFLPTSVAFRVTDIWRSYFTQALLHILDETISFVPVNAIQERNAHDYLSDFKQEEDVFDKAGDLVDFLSTWKCNSTMLEVCIQILSGEFSDRGFWTLDDAVLVQKWILDLKKAKYVFPKIQPSGFDSRIHNWPTPELLYTPGTFENIPYARRVRNCRRTHFHASIPIPRDSEDKQNLIDRAAAKIRDFSEVQRWCSEGEGSMAAANWTFPSKTQLAVRTSKRAELMQKYRKVAIITNNYPWRHGAGMIQRLHESTFGMIIFCGTWNPDQFSEDDKAFPKLRTPVSYIDISETEMNKGIHGYICLNKAAELRLRNVDGYIMFSDDAHVNSWYNFDQNTVYTYHRYFEHIIYWWDFRSWAGNDAVEIAIQLLRHKYADRPEIQEAVAIYDRLLKSANYTWQGKALTTIEDHLRAKDSWMMSDIIHIPSQNMRFVTTMGEIFYEAGIFHEIVFSKLMAILPNSHAWSDPTEMVALLGEPRAHWYEYYKEELVGIHALKFSDYIRPGEMRTTYCDVALDAFHRNHFWR